MTTRPLYDQVIVKRTKAEDKTKGGIYIPEAAKEKPLEAIVMAVGCGKVLDNGSVREPAVKVNDRVLLAKYSGAEVRINDEEMLVIRESDILAIIE